MAMSILESKTFVFVRCTKETIEIVEALLQFLGNEDYTRFFESGVDVTLRPHEARRNEG